MPRILPCLLLFLVAGASVDELLTNGEFEARFDTGGVATGWADNSRTWADLDVTYARDASDPHAGAACQRISCTRLDSGAVQFIATRPLPIVKGDVYRVRGWVKGDVGPTALQIRQMGSPYRVYVEQTIHVETKWKFLEYYWTATLDDPKALFMVRFTKPGDAWLDDLSVAKVDPDEAAKEIPPPPSGNLLHNGRFDLGKANWLIGRSCDAWRAAELTIETIDGNPCAKLVVPEGIHVNLSSDSVRVAPGHEVRVACRIKADSLKRILIGSTHCGNWVDAGPQWKNVSAAGTIRFTPRCYDHARIAVTGPAVLWIDDVALWQDGSAKSSARFQAAVVPDRHPLSYYHDGETVTVRLLASVPEDTAKQVDWRIEDFWGTVRRSGKWTPTANEPSRRLDLSDLPRGWYRASVRWGDGGERLNQTAFVILPPPERTSPPEKSPFGAHFALDPTGLAVAKAVGVRRLRLHPPNATKWRVVQPTGPEAWRWRDEAIAAAKAAGVELMGSLDRCPAWASTAPDGTADTSFYTGTGAWLPKDWEQWERYVAETVRRYKSDIHRWEVWNEPNLVDWLIPRKGQSRAEAYVELLKHTTPIVRREDPTAVVIGGCVAGAMTDGSRPKQFAFDVIDLGGLELMDEFSFHDYIIRPIDEGREPIHVWLEKLREKMRAAGRELPIVNSEGGFANPGTSISYRPCPANTIPPSKMARWLVRQYVAQIAGGVRQFYFYNCFIDGSPRVLTWQGFLEGDGQPLPNVAAYAHMTWILDGAEFERTEHPADHVTVHHFRTSRGPLAVAWAETGKTVPVAFSRVTAAWDLVGASVTLPSGGQFELEDAPIYLRLAE